MKTKFTDVNEAIQDFEVMIYKTMDNGFVEVGMSSNSNENKLPIPVQVKEQYTFRIQIL